MCVGGGWGGGGGGGGGLGEFKFEWKRVKSCVWAYISHLSCDLGDRGLINRAR